MDLKNIFEKRNKKYENIDKDNLDFYNQRLETKLTLRKQKFNEILSKKRLLTYNSIINNNNKKSKWKLLYNIKNMDFPKELANKYKFNFNNNDEEKILSLSLKFLKSDNKHDIKYSLILLQIFINNHMNSDLTNYINLLFIYDLFNLIEKRSKDKQIIFNILYIISNYSYVNTDDGLSVILLSPKAYKKWELCFNLQNYEIFEAMLNIFNNIVNGNQIAGCNLIRSNFFQKYIYNFFMSQTILSQINNKDKKDIIYIIIEEGINLFCQLLLIPKDKLDILTKEEIFICKQKVINLVVCYSGCNSLEKHRKCIVTISSALEKEIRLFDELEKNDFIQNLLINKKFFEDKEIRHFVNQIIGNYLAYKIKVNHNFLLDVIKFEIEYLNMNNNDNYRKEIFWTLSNLVKCEEEIYNEILNNENLIKTIISCYKNTIYYNEIEEITYLFCILLHRANIKQFIKVEENHLMEIAINYAKNILHNKLDGLYLVFQLFEIYFSYGEIVKEKFDNKNMVIDRFNKLGGKELLEKYQYHANEKICQEINYIFKEFYNIKNK